MSPGRLQEIFEAAVRAVDPHQSVIRHLRWTGKLLSIDDRHLDLERYRRAYVVGAGKATSFMAAALERLLPERIDKGIIVVKDGHACALKTIEQIEAAHPVPDRRGLAGTERIMALLRDADAQTLVICLLSGGASALLVAPAEGLTLGELSVTNELLLASGVDIADSNTVRKHLSRIKGGRLAVLAHPAPVLSLIVSDVIGDRLDVIASGPTVPDPTTYGEALGILKRTGILRWAPRAVIEHLKRGVEGEVPETPKSNDPVFELTSNHIICSNRLALDAAKARAEEQGLETRIVTSTLQGEARSAARSLAETAISLAAQLGPEARAQCLLAGGETTVALRGKGRGGRNQELALAFALEIAGRSGISCLSAGTDGTDGPTDATGAVVDADTVPLALKAGLDPRVFLANNDSYGFFESLAQVCAQAAHHLKPGPTGTNVMDLVAVTVRPPRRRA